LIILNTFKVKKYLFFLFFLILNYFIFYSIQFNFKIFVRNSIAFLWIINLIIKLNLLFNLLEFLIIQKKYKNNLKKIYIVLLKFLISINNTLISNSIYLQNYSSVKFCTSVSGILIPFFIIASPLYNNYY
jgi:hypothetical protein